MLVARKKREGRWSRGRREWCHSREEDEEGKPVARKTKRAPRPQERRGGETASEEDGISDLGGGRGESPAAVVGGGGWGGVPAAEVRAFLSRGRRAEANAASVT